MSTRVARSPFRGWTGCISEYRAYLHVWRRVFISQKVAQKYEYCPLLRFSFDILQTSVWRYFQFTPVCLRGRRRLRLPWCVCGDADTSMPAHARLRIRTWVDVVACLGTVGVICSSLITTNTNFLAVPLLSPFCSLADSLLVSC